MGHARMEAHALPHTCSSRPAATPRPEPGGGTPGGAQIASPGYSWLAAVCRGWGRQIWKLESLKAHGQEPFRASCGSRPAGLGLEVGGMAKPDFSFSDYYYYYYFGRAYKSGSFSRRGRGLKAQGRALHAPILARTRWRTPCSCGFAGVGEQGAQGRDPCLCPSAPFGPGN